MRVERFAARSSAALKTGTIPRGNADHFAATTTGLGRGPDRAKRRDFGCVVIGFGGQCVLHHFVELRGCVLLFLREGLFDLWRQRRLRRQGSRCLRSDEGENQQDTWEIAMHLYS